MSKIKLIIGREYKNRVKKKSFILMCFLGPILFSSLFIISGYIQNSIDEPWNIVVVDESKLYSSQYKGRFKFEDTHLIDYNLEHLNDDYSEVKSKYFESERHAVIRINQNILNNWKSTTDQPKLLIAINYKEMPPSAVEAQLEDRLRELIQIIYLNTKTTRTDQSLLPSDLMEIDIKLAPEDLDSIHEKRLRDVKFGLGLAGSMLIYMFVLLFGAAVMKGVSEEKNSRIAEVLISSVKPFELMLGKIVGIGLSALTQFAVWVVLSITVMTGFSSYFSQQLLDKQLNQATELMENQGTTTIVSQEVVERSVELQTESFLELLSLVNWPTICGSFLFFFLGGYLLYSSMFAAIGASIDADTDPQQFVFPLTIPLIVAVIIASSSLDNPNNTLVEIASFFPLTSPVVMMARIPFGVPIWQVVISFLILIGTSYLTIKMAGKIYRTGILMYGQKVSYKTLWKWLRH